MTQERHMRWSCTDKLRDHLRKFAHPGMSTDARAQLISHLLEWDGCFNDKKRLRTDLFRPVFERIYRRTGKYGQGAFGDVDGICEIRGRGLMLETKADGLVTGGQRVMYENLTATGILTVFVLRWEWADDTNTCTGLKVWWRGREYSLPEPVNFETVLDWVYRWVELAHGLPRPQVPPQTESEDAFEELMYGQDAVAKKAERDRPKVVAPDPSDIVDTNKLLEGFK